MGCGPRDRCIGPATTTATTATMLAAVRSDAEEFAIAPRDTAGRPLLLLGLLFPCDITPAGAAEDSGSRLCRKEDLGFVDAVPLGILVVRFIVRQPSMLLVMGPNICVCTFSSDGCAMPQRQKLVFHAGVSGVESGHSHLFRTHQSDGFVIFAQKSCLCRLMTTASIAISKPYRLLEHSLSRFLLRVCLVKPNRE